MGIANKVYVWSLQTGKLLDVLAGHEAPLSELSFSPNQGVLASASWDGTVKLWDVFKSECIEASLFAKLHFLLPPCTFCHRFGALAYISTVIACGAAADRSPPQREPVRSYEAPFISLSRFCLFLTPLCTRFHVSIT